MPNKRGNAAISFPDPTLVDLQEVGAFTREYDHLRLAHTLARETAAYVQLLSRTNPGSGDDWNIAHAIIGGHLVRLLKLFRQLLANAGDNRGEILFITCRVMAECIINFRFLLEHRKEEDVFISYLFQSLQHDRTLLEHIDATVSRRGNGMMLPIEIRMQRSVERTFRNSLVEPEELPKRRIRNWGGKDLKTKADELGLSSVYAHFFASQSRNVHGGWSDLLQHHLEVVKPGHFRPRFKDSRVRPQPFYTLSVLTIEALFDYLDALGPHRETPEIAERLRDLLARIELADRLHEEFLVNKRKTSGDGSTSG